VQDQKTTTKTRRTRRKKHEEKQPEIFFFIAAKARLRDVARRSERSASEWAQGPESKQSAAPPAGPGESKWIPACAGMTPDYFSNVLLPSFFSLFLSSLLPSSCPSWLFFVFFVAAFDLDLQQHPEDIRR
jgi:hypothetical protein